MNYAGYIIKHRKMKRFTSFGSDNNAPVHESVFRAMQEANQGDTIAYGDDLYTLEAEHRLKTVFGTDTQSFFTFSGTGANVAAISHLCRPYHAVVCSARSHLHNDECGALERFGGSKLLVLPSEDGKIAPNQIEPLLHSVGFQHHSQPKLISITQATEMGTVYTPSEISAIARFANDNDMFLHVDGARIANAAASLNISMREMITDTGVDVLSFGGTKNGLMIGEAIVFMNSDLARDFGYTHKQSMQLASKMRYISAQFNALLSNDLWLRNAQHANFMAKLLEEKIREIPEIVITQPVQTNAVFAIIPAEAIERLLTRFFFYVWNSDRHEVRWMTSYTTTEPDIDAFVDAIKDALK